MDHAAIITSLGAPAIAARLGCHPSRPYRWRNACRIPADHWPALVQLAAQTGAAGVTLETLAAGGRKRAAPAASQAEG